MKPATIHFKAKVTPVYTVGEETPCYYEIKVPEFGRHHCNMQGFQNHQKYGPYANSDFFKGMLGKIRTGLFPDGKLRLDRIPESVNVDQSGFLADITITV